MDIENEAKQTQEAIKEINNEIHRSINKIKTINNILEKYTLGKRIKTKIKRKFLTAEEEKDYYCVGCYNDIYTNKTVERCWKFSSAKICKRKCVYIDDVPPWKTQPILTVLSCYEKLRYIFVRPNREK